jgi:hypothetical protein
MTSLNKEHQHMSIYLEKSELQDAYYEANKLSKDWFKPFDEYERIAGNKLSKSLAKNMPRVNDGSLAAALLETPMQVYPSMQTGKFTSQNRKEAWLDEIANIIWKSKIVPNANTQAPFFDKEQIALYRALKYGMQPRYNFFVSNEIYTGSDWSLPYIRNLKLEPGKFSVDDCDYVFLDVYYTKLQLKKIIDRIGKDKDNGGWDVKLLKELADMAMTTKEMDEQNINEREKQIQSSGIKVTACFQRGVEAPFYMFAKPLGDKCIRTWSNPDPTGDLPITNQYCYENLESPYGIGRVELAGPTQNVLDYMTQAHVFATQVGLQPPKKLSGPTDQTNFNSLTFTPEALWQLGQAQIDVVQNTNSVYTQFPNNFGLYKSQLQTLQGRTDGSVSAESGNPNFSKTSAGVKMQEDRTNSQDNYLRNKADTASAKMAEKMMNVHMAQMQGADILDVAEDDIERLIKAGYLDDNPNTPEPSPGELPILYEDVKSTFKFEYDARPEADEDEKNRWLELIDIATSNPNIIPAMEQSGWRFNLGEAFKKVVNASGTADSEKVLTQISPEEMMQQQAQQVDPATGMPLDPAMQGQPMPEQMPPEMMQPEMAQPQGEDELQVTMEEYGVAPEVAQAIMQARAQGFEEEEILAYLKGDQ